MQKHPKLLPIAAALLAIACTHFAGSSFAAADHKTSQIKKAPARIDRIRYVITDLGTLPDGSSSQAATLSAAGRVVGAAKSADGMEHAVLWFQGRVTNIGPKGVNSGAFGVDASGQITGLTEIAAKDPNNENFCGYGSDRQCRPFLWQAGKMELLPLLGGNNGTIGNINLLGQIPGAAETAEIDPSCPKQAGVNGTGPQVLVYKPVIWGPKPGSVRELAMLPGDTVGMALRINDLGQAVGATGTCANTLPPPLVIAPHAVLWERDGTAVDLGNLGGAGDPRIGTGTHAVSINNRGQVVGVSVLGDNKTNRGFLWTRKGKMRSLEPLPGHPASAALGINNPGDVVGASGKLPFEDPNAVIWPNGGDPIDLNQRVAQPTPLHLLTAFAINDAGQIVGFALDAKSGNIHAFKATPSRERGSDASDD